MPSGTMPSSTWRAKTSLAPALPSAVEATAVRLDPLRRDVVRRVHRAEWEVEEERAVGRGVLLVLDVADRGVGEILGEVVAVFGRGGRIDVAGCRGRGSGVHWFVSPWRNP